MPLPIWLLVPIFFIWTLSLNFIACYLIKQQWKVKLFPLFEIIGTILLTALWLSSSYPLYFLLCSALLIVIHTDYNHMLISRFTSLYLIPTGIIASYFEYLPINIIESILAATLGYGLLWITNKLFYVIKKIDGIGQGDFELVALIGSYTGLLGFWFSILFGSTLGTCIGIVYMFYTGEKTLIMPFGIFLSLGAIIYIILQRYLLCF